jgi:hypothetical protein
MITGSLPLQRALLWYISPMSLFDPRMNFSGAGGENRLRKAPIYHAPVTILLVGYVLPSAILIAGMFVLAQSGWIRG